MGLERWRRKVERTLRVGSVVSIALAPYSSISPQKDGQKLSESSALVLNLDPSLLSEPLTFESNGARVIFGSPEQEQQAEQTSSRTVGLLAGFNKEGSVVLTTPEGVRKEIVLPRVERFAIGGMSVSPDGTRLAVWREKSDAGGFEVFLASVFGDEVSRLAPEVINNLDAYDRFGTFLRWSPDGRKLAVISGQHGGGKTVVFDPENGQKIFERRGSLFSEFSPDGNWFAKAGNRDIEVIGMEGQGIPIRNGGRLFSWSPDSRFIAFQGCIMWSPGTWGDQCMYSNLSVFEVETQRVRAFGQSEPYFSPVFSPDGKRIVFRKPSNTRIASLSVLDLERGETKSINLPSEEFSLNQNWTISFRNNNEALIWGQRESDYRLQLLLVDIRNARLLQQYWVSYTGIVFFLQAFQDKFIYGSEDFVEEKRTYFLVDFLPRDGALSPVPLADSPNSAGWLAKSTEIFGTVKEGDLIQSSNESFLYLDGRARRIIHEETRQFFENQRGELPPGLAPFVPEGEKIEFLPGEVIGHEDLGLWYLRNGKRYRIQNWDWFQSKQRFTNQPKSVERAIVERISAAQVPEPILGRNTILDWDGGLKEFQPFGGRMILFIGGYDGNTTSQLAGFQQIKGKLMEKGWNEKQFLEATYNIDIDVGRRLVLPTAYFAEHTHIYPPQNFSKISLEIQRYKEMFPLTKFILIGHSLGGLMALESARDHPDAVESVITLDSPIKGFDHFWWEEWQDLIVHYVGHEVGRYLVPIGSNDSAKEAQEEKVMFLRSREVKVFTFANYSDLFVTGEVALANNPSTEFEGQPVSLVWFLPRTPLEDPVSDLIFGHGQILRDESFIEHLMRIFPSS